MCTRVPWGRGLTAFSCILGFKRADDQPRPVVRARKTNTRDSGAVKSERVGTRRDARTKNGKERKREIQHVPSSSPRVSSFLFFSWPKAPRTSKRSEALSGVTLERSFLFLASPSRSPHLLPGRSLSPLDSRPGTKFALVKSTVSLVFDLSYNGLEARREAEGGHL